MMPPRLSGKSLKDNLLWTGILGRRRFFLWLFLDGFFSISWFLSFGGGRLQDSCSKQLQEKAIPIDAVIHKWFIFTMGFYILSILQGKSGTIVLRDAPGKETERIG